MEMQVKAGSAAEAANAMPPPRRERNVRYTRIDDFARDRFPSVLESLLLCGDARESLALLPNACVQTVVTSPPYWSLRDYRVEDQVGCDDSLDSYIGRLVRVFEEVRRVLRPDGTVWLNVGDVYTSGNRRYRAPDRKYPVRAMSVRPPTPDGLKPKDLIGVPWRLALALQAAGWWLRSEVIWHKTNANPESVRDRPTKAHKTVFLFSKEQDYHFDDGAARGPNGRRIRDVWDLPTEPLRRRRDWPADHPAMMPLSLARRCLALTSRPDGIVMDPYAGSGTTIIAAQEIGCRWIGVEIKSAFADLIERRMSCYDA